MPEMSATPVVATETGQPPESSAPPRAAAPAAPRFFGLPPQYIAPLFITCVLLVADASYRVLEAREATLLAIVAAIATELILGRLVQGKWPQLASAYVTGISVGILTRSQALWPFALCSMIAITSKYALRLKGRHLWNPSNFGISVLLLAAPFAYSTLSVQWGNATWGMVVIWTLGTAIIWKLRRFHICATYVASFFFFSWLRSLLNGQSFWMEAAPITGPMYQLFIFFMITDPKTTVKGKIPQMAVAFAIAAMECVLRLYGDIHAPYYALFIVGPAANLLEIWLTSWKQARVSQPVSLPADLPITLAEKPS
jgi:Na+-translocating ferredoxin:NAD+ oxidoreductase RnfD subunit